MFQNVSGICVNQVKHADMEMIVMRKFILKGPWQATQERVDEEAARKRGKHGQHPLLSFLVKGKARQGTQI